MRSVLVYLLYWPMSPGFKPALLVDGTPNPDSYIPTPNVFRLWVILSLLFTFLLFVVHLWSIHVEPKMGAATNSLERVSRSWGNMPNFPGKEHGLLPISIAKQASA